MRTQHTVAAVALATSAIAPVFAAEAKRPRGVGPEFAKFYKTPEVFTCISNPSVKIPFSSVNDDVCDCPDGSDEPGTSACSYISTYSAPSVAHYIEGQTNNTLALPGYYCKNKGHRPNYVPFTYVNDGVCDYDLCCDGSDEWEGVGGVKCEDKCKEIGKEWRKKDEVRQRSLGAAIRKRRELITESSKLKKECEDRIEDLKVQIEALKIKHADVEKVLAETERKDRARVIHAPKEGGRVGTLLGLGKQRTEELRDSLRDLKFQRDDYKSRLGLLEGIMTTFKEQYNPNFNDEGVKRAVRAWEDYVAVMKLPELDEGKERDLVEVLKTDEENGLKWADWENADLADDTAVLYKLEEYLPKPLRDWIDQKLRDLRVMMVENGILAANSGDGTESQAVTDARTQVFAASADLNARRMELTTHEADLIKDYGPEEILRSLKDKCIMSDSGEYTYEMCWMARTTQMPKNNGANTGMGTFTGIEWVTVDEEVPADGKGLGSGMRLALKYENGQQCWNGPMRSTTVVLACAETDEIWKITEEEKCVYRMDVGTPAACELPGLPATEKDEL